MIRVCSTCGGKGLANWERYLLKNRAVWNWIGEAADDDSSNPVASMIDGRLCRTCGGRGVTGIEEARDWALDIISRHNELIREWNDDKRLRLRCNVESNRARRENEKLRAELRDISEVLTEWRGLVGMQRLNVDMAEDRCDRLRAEFRDLAERAGELEEHAEWYYGIAEEARIEAGGDQCEDDPPWDRPWHDDQG